MKRFVLATGLFLVAGCGQVQDPNSLMGEVGPDFQLDALQSKSLHVTLSQYKGKAVIMDFWATWCGPCKMLSPFVEQIAEDYKAKGLVAMAISDEDRGTVQKFESNTPHHIPVYLDPNDVAHFEYHVEGLPTVVIIDRAGKVVFQETGIPGGEMTIADQAMRTAVETALAAK